MTEPDPPAPNSRSAGTPACHPNDALCPPAQPSPARASSSPRSAYVELHASSAFSFLAAAAQPEALVERAAALGLPAMALTDRNGLYGAARFHTEARRRGLQAHIGAEIAVACFGKQLAPPPWLPHQHPAQPPRITLLCASQTGYQNLCQLITRFKMRATTKTEGAATLDDLEEFSAGLICLTGGQEGPLAAALAHDGQQQMHPVLERLVSIYGHGNLYLELQRHQERPQEHRNQALLSAAARYHLPVIATNGVRYAVPKDRELLDLMTAIRHHTTLKQAGRLLAVNSQRCLRTSTEMAALFHDLPEAIANTGIVSSRLSFTLDNLGYQFPHYPVPQGETMDSFLARRVAEGVELRYGSSCKRHLLARARTQVAHELALIAKLGFSGYFLIVWDLIRFCQSHGFLVQGRGSAANSAVCYALQITAVDPIGMELLFERFLSEDRGEWPDIDLDFASGDEREQVIQYLYQRYGALGAAMTANVITYRSRSAAREVGKALGFEPEQITRLSSLLGHWEWRGAHDTLEHHFAQAGLDIRHPRIACYLDLCRRLKEMPRHLGQHSGGMVICAGLLNRVVPIEPASMPGRTVIQWDKEDCADMGLIKVDLLGLGMMAALRETINLIPLHYGRQVDLAALPEDPLVYQTLRQADTVGMFQVESRAQMASLPHNAPQRFYDLVVQVAIIRPGPIVGRMMHPYMRRRQGKEPVSYPHPLLEPVLKRTLGVPLFQEQLLRMAMAVADFTGAEAEQLRRAVGMRRSMQRMKDLEGRLRAGMTRNNIGAETQDNIVQAISSFAMYGFPESHAASFALIAYASAYLKVHYLAAFTCGLLNNQPMGFYSPAVLIKDAQRHGLRVHPIDVQRSFWRCTLEKEPDGALSLRLGLNYAKGLRQSSAQALLVARTSEGLFPSVDLLAQRVPELSRKEITLLARIGALNWLGGPGCLPERCAGRLPAVLHRRDALWQAAQAARPVGPLLRQAHPASATSCAPSAFAEQVRLRPMTASERLAADFAGTGLTAGPHPMAYRRSALRLQGILPADALTRCPNNRHVRIAGCVIARQRPGTAKGFVFLSLEDETGIANVIITHDLFEEQRLLITRSRFLLVAGPVQNQSGVIHVKAQGVSPLEAYE